MVTNTLMLTRYLQRWINTLIQYNLSPGTFYFASVGAFFSKGKSSKNSFSLNSCAFPYQDSLDRRSESLKALPRLYCSRLLLLISPLNIFLCKQSSSSFTECFTCISTQCTRRYTFAYRAIPTYTLPTYESSYVHNIFIIMARNQIRSEIFKPSAVYNRFLRSIVKKALNE